ncbi:aspartate kinase [Campylobacter hyointestinalis]|uniref:Aspartokinase n=1 Tax=Campylobacter hyointestinalis subsp. hyointestinalis TaxID=91352 RepID=A0A855NB49_CAMHY|nr:aspartate kinase [Campylobacter hyointestinalis]PPB57076.1 aspartate kinase [Campylobacter hyointestinalis subsp. hyointestinalis]PPB59378.1 aspartate kinase [Campylobacter hyointestinalis subsp. hyointestinalis]PPB64215.1 aspartate kinase [Campylobacter hyointestinalis subsp. hyointestinalis]PPB71777.1 aspartate kinase [Campylobacter hyointestinalis subsp. hyointestinalis]QCT99716.1 aspartate kinase [Campylobacter hyointestinalis subsp. hyointestinalis]
MLIVQKYGGTSVGTLERIEEVSKRVIDTKKAGNDVVVVVSAMSGVTNKLIEYAEYFTKIAPASKDMDMLLSAGERVTSSLLSIALNEKGYEAVAMSGRTAGIITDNTHTKARILEIDCTNLKKALGEGKIVVVAGFQGVSVDGDVTTLGRGGSDLSAVALAGALHADLCEIYTDVDGVYTTDPRIEPKAKKLDKISYDEMLELASMGAKVLQNRSVELAKKLNVNLVTRSSFNNNEGTLITGEANMENSSMEQVLISGIALDKNQARVTLRGVVDKPGVAAAIFTKLAAKNINVDMIIQNTSHEDGTTSLGFTVPQNEMEAAREVVEGTARSVEIDSDVVKVSVVGVGMKSHSGIASLAFTTLADEGINIQMISTSEIKISMIVASKYGELAVRALHKAYKLDA